jgi:hypothetical protein
MRDAISPILSKLERISEGADSWLAMHEVGHRDQVASIEIQKPVDDLPYLGRLSTEYVAVIVCDHQASGTQAVERVGGLCFVDVEAAGDG